MTSIAFNERDEYILSASRCGDILLHDVSNGSGTSICSSDSLTGSTSKAIHAIQYSPFRKGVAAVAGDECTVQLWDTARGVSVSQFTQHKAPVMGVCFSPVNDLLLCSAGLDKMLHFFDVQVHCC